jgi:hypothetical protein
MLSRILFLIVVIASLPACSFVGKGMKVAGDTANYLAGKLDPSTETPAQQLIPTKKETYFIKVDMADGSSVTIAPIRQQEGPKITLNVTNAASCDSLKMVRKNDGSTEASTISNKGAVLYAKTLEWNDGEGEISIECLRGSKSKWILENRLSINQSGTAFDPFDTEQTLRAGRSCQNRQMDPVSSTGQWKEWQPCVKIKSSKKRRG